MKRTIERIGTVNGRWPRYSLIVDGVMIGTVRRSIAKGRDGLAGRAQPTYDVWQIAGTDLATREAAEARLIERAITFNLIGA